jgi:transcriptional regulator with XRE-family HTH domain
MRKLEQGGAEMATIGAVMPHVDGEKLTELREERFLSHRELAKLAGVSPQTVLNLEHGKGEQAQRRTIRKLAQALGVQPQELVKPVE